MYDTIIFDFDGTLGETTVEGRHCLLNTVLSKCGGCADPVSIDRFWYETDRSGIVRSNFGVDPEVFWPVYREHDGSDFRKEFLSCYPDIIALKELKRMGVTMAMMSGAPYPIVEYGGQMIAKFAGEDIFSAIVVATDHNGLRRKPHPDGLFFAMNILDANQESTLYVGNGEEDVQAARNAGVTDIWIDRGEYTFDLEPTFTIKKLDELIAISSSQRRTRDPVQMDQALYNRQ